MTTQELHRRHDPVSWIFTVPYLVVFGLILVLFQPALFLARLLSKQAFLRALTSMCRAIIANLRITTGSTITFSRDGISEELLRDRSVILISNHQSMYDIPYLIHLFADKNPAFIAKQELAYWIPSVSFAVRNNDSALIDRSDRHQAFTVIERACSTIAREKRAISIFPEGTRARSGVTKQFHRGGILKLLKSLPDSVVIPVAISGSWEHLRYNFLPVPYGVTVQVKALAAIDLRTSAMGVTEVLEHCEELIILQTAQAETA